MTGWTCRERTLDLSRTKVMGILNVTPDSFSDAGVYLDVDAAVRRGVEMVEQSADIIDVGGESTRPGASPVDEAEERSRVIPVVTRLAREVDAAISIDTAKASVAEAALEAGAHIVNDVTAMRGDRLMAKVVAGSGAGLVLMHMLGEPRTMQENPTYTDVVSDVKQALLGWAETAESAGVARSAICIDPGIGFGKTLEHNLSLIRSLRELADSGFPVLLGPSRKSFIGAVLDVPVDERVEGTSAVAAWAVTQGVRVLRVHDVEEMVRVIRMTEAILGVR